MGTIIWWGLIAVVVAGLAWLVGGVSFWAAVLILFITVNVQAFGFILFNYLRGGK